MFSIDGLGALSCPKREPSFSALLLTLAFVSTSGSFYRRTIGGLMASLISLAGVRASCFEVDVIVYLPLEMLDRVDISTSFASVYNFPTKILFSSLSISSLGTLHVLPGQLVIYDVESDIPIEDIIVDVSNCSKRL